MNMENFELGFEGLPIKKEIDFVKYRFKPQIKYLIFKVGLTNNEIVKVKLISNRNSEYYHVVLSKKKAVEKCILMNGKYFMEERSDIQTYIPHPIRVNLKLRASTQEIPEIKEDEEQQFYVHFSNLPIKTNEEDFISAICTALKISTV